MQAIDLLDYLLFGVWPDFDEYGQRRAGGLVEAR